MLFQTIFLLLKHVYFADFGKCPAIIHQDMHKSAYQVKIFEKTVASFLQFRYYINTIFFLYSLYFWNIFSPIQVLYKYYFFFIFFIFLEGEKMWHEKPILSRNGSKCGQPC